MTLPPDPFETRIEELIQHERAEQEQWKKAKAQAEEEIVRLGNNLASFRQTLEAHRRMGITVHKNGINNPSVDEKFMAEQLEGLTIFEKCVKLALLNDRCLKPTETARFLHRIGAMGGNVKNAPSRLWHLMEDNADTFVKVGTGEFELMPGAENDVFPEKIPPLFYNEDDKHYDITNKDNTKNN